MTNILTILEMLKILMFVINEITEKNVLEVAGALLWDIMEI